MVSKIAVLSNVLRTPKYAFEKHLKGAGGNHDTIIQAQGLRLHYIYCRFYADSDL